MRFLEGPEKGKLVARKLHIFAVKIALHALGLSTKQ